MRYFSLGILLVSMLVIGCTSIDCPVQNRVETIYALKKTDGSIDTLGVDTMWVWTHNYEGKDTLLINRLCGDKAISFELPVSHTQPEDSIFTLLKDTLSHTWLDTICVKKENYPHFESVDCQAAYFHKITAVSSTQHIIESIHLNNPDVNYDTNENIHLYLKARR